MTIFHIGAPYVLLMEPIHMKNSVSRSQWMNCTLYFIISIFPNLDISYDTITSVFLMDSFVDFGILL